MDAAKVHCPICRSAIRSETVLNKSGMDLFHCSDCSHWVVSPFPSEAELERIYSFASGYQQSAAHLVESSRAVVPRKFVDRISRLLAFKQDGRLLDVGCSFGQFLEVAQAKGFDVEGVEVSEDTAAIAIQRGFKVAIGTLHEAAYPDAYFDVVHAGDVIEHLTDVHSFVAEIRRILKPGGLVVVATPNHESFFPRATLALWRRLGIPWSHATPPYHLHQFSHHSLELLLKEYGLSPVDRWFDPVRISYELRAAGTLSAMKAALSKRSPKRFSREAVLSVGVLATYPLVRMIDMLRFWRRVDAKVTVIALSQTE